MRRFFILLVIMLLTGCGVRQSMPESFWHMHDKKLGIAIVRYPKVQPIQSRSTGMVMAGGLIGALIDAAAAKENKSANEVLAGFDYGVFTDGIRSIGTRLQKAQFKPVMIDQFVDLDQLPEFAGPPANLKYYSKDLSKLTEEQNLDLLLLFEVKTLSKYEIADKVYCVVSGHLIDTKTNSILWHSEYTRAGEKTIVRMPDEWNAPPDYPGLIESLNQSMKIALQLFEEDIFGRQTRTEPR